MRWSDRANSLKPRLFHHKDSCPSSRDLRPGAPDITSARKLVTVVGEGGGEGGGTRQPLLQLRDAPGGSATFWWKWQTPPVATYPRPFSQEAGFGAARRGGLPVCSAPPGAPPPRTPGRQRTHPQARGPGERREGTHKGLSPPWITYTRRPVSPVYHSFFRPSQLS